MKVIFQKYDKLEQILKEHFVDKLEAFGSITTADFKEDSDIDLLVTFKKIPFLVYSDNYFSLLKELELLFQRDIDLCIYDQNENTYFLNLIKDTKKKIYEDREI